MVFAAFILGFTGSLHCIGMCSPIAMIVSGQNSNRRLINRLVYNIGRVFTYVFMGVVVGIMGKLVSGNIWQSALSIGIGVFILFIVMIPGIQRKFIPSLNKGVARVKYALTKYLHQPGLSSALATGLLNGLLPCGLVYGALGLALVQFSVFESVLVMLVFGMGTIPALVVAAYSWHAVKKYLPWSVSRIQTAMLIAVSVFMIGRGLMHQPDLFTHGKTEIVCRP